LRFFRLSRLFGLDNSKYLLHGIYVSPALTAFLQGLPAGFTTSLQHFLSQTAERRPSYTIRRLPYIRLIKLTKQKSASSQVMRRGRIRRFLTPLPDIFSSFSGQQNLQKVTAMPTHFRKLYTCKFLANLRF
jgi:hypothetical protein